MTLARKQEARLDAVARVVMAQRGTVLDPARLGHLLADQCPEAKAARRALVAALEDGIGAQLAAWADPRAQVVPRFEPLVTRLQQESALKPELAEWAVHTLAGFHGLASPPRRPRAGPPRAARNQGVARPGGPPGPAPTATVTGGRGGPRLGYAAILLASVIMACSCARPALTWWRRQRFQQAVQAREPAQALALAADLGGWQPAAEFAGLYSLAESARQRSVVARHTAQLTAGVEPADGPGFALATELHAKAVNARDHGSLEEATAYWHAAAQAYREAGRTALHRQQVEALIRAAHAARQRADWGAMRAVAAAALAAEPTSPEARSLAATAATEAALTAATAAGERSDWDRIMRLAEEALGHSPGEPRAESLLGEARSGIAMRGAEMARRAADWGAARQYALAALTLRPGEPRAVELRTEAELKIALAACREAAGRRDWQAVVRSAQGILRRRPDHADAADQLRTASVELALDAAAAAQARRDWPAVERWARLARDAQPGHRRAEDLLRQCQAERGRREAEAAGATGDWGAVEDLAQEVLTLCPGDEDALSLLNRAREEQQRTAAVRARQAAGLPFALPGLGIALVRLPPGDFTMGSSARKAPAPETPAHAVRLSYGFWLGRHELTQEQYARITEHNPSRSQGPQLPVEQVSWHDAMAFCATLTERERQAGRLPAGYEYRLPTEAEWEYACRAGSPAEEGVDLERVAWHAGNSHGTPHPVGSKQANAWGLHDLQGNVREWCLDRFDPRFYEISPAVDPFSCSRRAVGRPARGGDWSQAATTLRSTSRWQGAPQYADETLGFRVALAPERTRSALGED